MHPTLTFYRTCSGLLIVLSLTSASTSWGQDTRVQNLRPEQQSDVNKKEATGGLWSSASKFRKRFLPFTVDNEEAESATSRRQQQAGKTKDRRLAPLQSTEARRDAPGARSGSTSVLKAPRSAGAVRSRDLVTMPAMSVPPAASRQVTDRESPRATPATNAIRGKSRSPVTRSVVSKSITPTANAVQSVATADLREGQSSRRKNRLSRVDTNVTQDVPRGLSKTMADESADTPAKFTPDRSRATSSEVRASDRQAGVRSALPPTADRGSGVQRSAKNLDKRGKQANRDVPGRSVSQVGKVLRTGPASNPVRSATATAVAPERANSSARQRQISASRANPLSGRGNDKIQSQAATITSDKKIASDLPQRVSARLTSQTVGGELGDSLLFTKNPQLTVETLGPSEVVIGKEATFKIRLRNLGDPVAESVLVRINTPLGAQIVAAQPSRGQTNSVAASKQKPLEWRLERLDAHETEFLTLRIVPRKSDAFDLGVTWTLAPIASQARIKVQEPKLNLEIVGPHEIDYGDTKIYRLTITNPGNGVADNVQLKLKPLDGSSRPMAVRDLGSLDPGDKQVMEVELTARQNGYLNVEAQASADTGLEAAARQRVLVRRAQLAIDAKGPEMNYAGTTATYRFQVDNQGNSSAKNIRVVATLPTGGDYLDSSDQGKWNAESRQVVWNVPALVAQNNQTFEVRVSLSHPGENLFGVRLSADDDLAASSEVKTLVEALADLQLVINDPRGPVPIDEETTYEVLISNRGTKAAEMVDVVVFFSEGIEPLSVAGGNATVNPGQVIFHPIDQIAPGEDVIYKIAARANRSGNHVFRTEVACDEADVRLVAEESTRFYGAHSVQKQARKETERPATESDKSIDTTDDVPAYRRSKS